MFILMCRFFWCLFFVTLFFCHCPLLFAGWLLLSSSSVVGRLILYTNLHVEIIVNHMFYEHQHLVCLLWKKNSFPYNTCVCVCLFSTSIFFVIVYLSPLVWIEDNVLFYYSDSTIWKWSLNYLFYYLCGYKYTFRRSIYMYIWTLGFVCVCQMKAISILNF